ncbi:MAG: HAD hydrolase family protein [Lachnospiraceae bacterium]|nr:HAD hydrolase family protein [Lachnospiraceae bacterium]
METDTRRNFELRFIKELFVFTKCEESEAVVKDLRKVLNTNVVDVFHNGVKVYVVPKALDKGKAVERFRSYIGADYVIAAGDSEFDIPMLEAADRGIAAPELAQGCFFADKIQCPSIERVFAEAVLETVSKEL